MLRLFVVGIAVLSILAAAAAVAQTASGPALETIELFNGRNFDGLEIYTQDAPAGVTDVGGIWRIEDGMLRAIGVGKGYIRTKMPYADYMLHVEWRWPKGPGNSGVLLNIVNGDLVWPKSFEAQLKTDRAGDFALFADARSKEEIVSRNPSGVSTGRLERPGPSLEKPLGEWNAYDITVAGDTITLAVNAVEVNRMTGVAPSAGFIGLQTEGTAIDFRNVTLTPLPPAKDLNAPMPTGLQ